MRFHTDFPFSSDKRLVSFIRLSVFWIVGLFFGAYISLSMLELCAPSITLMLKGKLTFGGLFFTQLLPFILIFVAARNSCDFLVCLTVFLKASLYAYFASGLLAVFQTAGWLLLSILMFCDCLSLPLFWFVCIRAVLRTGDNSFFTFASVLTILCFFCTVCVFVVEPFLAAIM